MKQDDKELLRKDLCARLPYGVKCFHPYGVGELDSIDVEDYGIDVTFKTSDDNYYSIEECKPYLRPMSSMTEKEFLYFMGVRGMNFKSHEIQEMMSEYFTNPNSMAIVITLGRYYHNMDWLNENMFDYRGLIEKGLALEAPAGMYNKEDKQ